MRASIVFAILTILAARPVGACSSKVTPAQCCASQKIKAVANAGAAQLLCYAAVAKNPGGNVDPECLAKARTKLAAAFQKAEQAGGCATVGDAEAINTTVIDIFGVETGPGFSPTPTPSACDCSGTPNRVAMTVQASSGTCGTVHDTTGGIRNLDCGTVYTGGGGRDQNFPVVNTLTQYADVFSCSGSRLALGAASASSVGNRNCTKAACPYGAPFELSPPTVCVVSTLRADIAGTVDCRTGEANVASPVKSDIYNGSCPLCSGGFCDSGASAGSACTADTPAGTSVDCLPTPGAFIATAFNFDLVSTTGTTAKAPLAGGQSQTDTFCGFCRASSDLFFESPAHRCVLDSDCTNGAFDVCQQYTGGAFGNTDADNVATTGTPAGDLTDGLAHTGIVAGTFCIGPSDDSLVNTNGDIPSPGAASAFTAFQLFGFPVIGTVAGNGVSGSGGDGGGATGASLAVPNDITLDSALNLYIADEYNNRVRRVNATTNIITTFAGTGGAVSNGDGGPATAAGVYHPTDVGIDSAGNVLIVDRYGNKVRRVDGATGIISTFAGTGTAGFSGDNGPATLATIDNPFGIWVDGADNVFIADANNNRVRRVDGATGIITTVAGIGSIGFSGDGGLATAAQITFPQDVVTDAGGNLYISDPGNERIRRVDAGTGIITTVAGTGTTGFGGDGGPATAASLFTPRAVALDAAGNLFIADSNNNRIRRVDAVSGIITTVAGTGTGGFAGDGGLAKLAQLYGPSGLAFDGTGALLVCDRSNFRIRRIKPGP